MNWLDILVIIVLGVLTFWGLKRGLIGCIVPLAGIVLGIILAGAFHDSLGDKLSFFNNQSLANVVSFTLIIVVVFLLATVVGKITRKILQMTLLGWADRLGGALLGFATGWLVCSMVSVLIARYIALPADLTHIPASGLIDWLEGLSGIRQFAYNAIDRSRLAALQLDTFPLILGLLPGEFDAVKKFFGG
ncbi:MAG: CvpA family protein [Chloroflexota bacterium]|nr:CvpA family protein [Chloroflexota bacterium]